MKGVRVSLGRRGSSVQTRSVIVGVSSRWAGHLGGGQFAPGGVARLPGAGWRSGDEGLGEVAEFEGQWVSRVGPSVATAALGKRAESLTECAIQSRDGQGSGAHRASCCVEHREQAAGLRRPGDPRARYLASERGSPSCGRERNLAADDSRKRLEAASVVSRCSQPASGHGDTDAAFVARNPARGSIRVLTMSRSSMIARSL